MSKFTKGEWEVKPLEDDKDYTRIRGTVLGSKFKVANVVDDKSHHDGSAWCEREREESLANAHLIACAPEMLEMLEIARNELYQVIDEVNDQRLCSVNSTTETQPDLYDMETLYLIDKLLAKARGEV